VEWEHVGSTLQLAANGTTLPHFNPCLLHPAGCGRCLQRGGSLPNGILEKARGINTYECYDPLIQKENNGMAHFLIEIKDQALQLSPKDRTRLAGKLLTSLD